MPVVKISTCVPEPVDKAARERSEKTRLPLSTVICDALCDGLGIPRAKRPVAGRPTTVGDNVRNNFREAPKKKTKGMRT